MITTPVLLLIFNRPDTALQVIEAIKKAQPARIYIAADGPRAHKAGEAALCQQTRTQVLAQIDWDCEVFTLFREENLGCALGVSGAIDWFFQQEEMGIILEDDCLPSESFFSFCQELLLRYKDDERIMHISGFNDQDGIKRGFGSYYFSNYPRIWGWASWKRAWEHYELTPEPVNRQLIEEIIASHFYNHKKAGERWFTDYERLLTTLSTWDYQWCLCIWKQGGLSINANVPLIKNIGFDGRGTHTTAPDKELMTMQLHNVEGKIQHPKTLLSDRAADLLSLKKHLYPDLKRRLMLKSASCFNKMLALASLRS